MFAVYRFYVDYAPARENVEHTNPVTGETTIQRRKAAGTREVHKVVYGPLGAADRTQSVAIVEHLRPKSEEGVAAQGSADEQAWLRWNTIYPAYQKWLKGQEITPDGTPLAAWSGVGPEQAEGLRRREILTVEQLAQLNDSHFEKYGIQNLRLLRDNAKRFVASQGSVQFEAALEQKDLEIAGLKEMLGSMAETMKQMQHTVANLQMAQQSAPDDGGHSDQNVNNDDAFGDDDVVPAPRRRARG